ncbi:MAG: DUF2339 domain-containing protein [Phycisphaerales bacterium]|nr:DUF2339 domain-containing protein [Phycisphaerales bacterium]
MSAQSDSEMVRELREVVQRLEQRLTGLESRLNALEPAPPPKPIQAVKPIQTVPPPPISSPSPVPPPAKPIQAAMPPPIPAPPVPPPATARPVPPVPPPIPAKEPPSIKPPTDDRLEVFARLTAAKKELPPLELPPQYRPRPIAGAAKPVVQPVAQPVSPPPPRSGESLESRIGKAWASWVGGLFVLGAVLYGLKLMWDHGWIHPTPLMRILAASAVGIAMIGTGQWLHVKRMRMLAASLVGCGLAVLMATMFAANIFFAPPVLSRGAAFALVIVVGGAGIAFALQMRIMSLAILALLGMYISPAILNSGDDQSLAFLVYLAVVTATGLGVSFFKRNWWAVRILTFVCGWLWLVGWTIKLSGEHGLLGTVACSAFFALYLAELVASLHRVMTPPVDEMAPDRPPSPNTLRLENGAAVMAFANTTLAMSLFAAIDATGAGMSPLWTLTLGLAGVMGILAFVTPSRPFSLSAGIQAMALVAVAVPLYFSHSAITFAWATLGLALGIYARITNNRFARVWMFVMLLLVIGRLWMFDVADPRLNGPLFSIGGETFSAWMLMNWGAALYALGLGWLSAHEAASPTDPKKTGGMLRSVLIAFCAVAGTLLTAATAGKGLASLHVFTLVVALWILVLIAWNNLALPTKYRTPGEVVALILLVLATIKWAIVDGFFRLTPGQPGHNPFWSFFNLFALNAVLLATGVCLSQLLRKLNLAVRVVWVTILVLGVAAKALPGLEDPFTLAAIIWTLLLIGWSYLLRSPERRTAVSIVALVLLVLISAKWVLIDGIVNAPSPFSLLSLFTLNGLLLATGVYLSQPLQQNATVRAWWITVLAFVIMISWLPMGCQLTLAAALWSLALIGWSNLVLPKEQRASGETVALILLVITSMKWMLYDGIANSILEPVGYDGKLGFLPPFVNLFVLSGILLMAGIYFSQLLRKRLESGPYLSEQLNNQHLVLRAWWITLLAFVALNVEAIRCVDYWPPPGVDLLILKNVIVSVLWGVLGLLGILVGFRRRVASVRWVALALLGITVAKVLLIDMAKVETVFRVLSFAVLGIVLLLVSFVYHKRGAIVAGTDAKLATDSPSAAEPQPNHETT